MGPKGRGFALKVSLQPYKAAGIHARHGRRLKRLWSKRQRGMVPAMIGDEWGWALSQGDPNRPPLKPVMTAKEWEEYQEFCRRYGYSPLVSGVLVEWDPEVTE